MLIAFWKVQLFDYFLNMVYLISPHFAKKLNTNNCQALHFEMCDHLIMSFVYEFFSQFKTSKETSVPS